MKNKLKVHRAIHDLTQAQLAQKANVSVWTINAMEANKYCPSLKLAFRISKIVEAPLTEIFFMEDEDYK